MKIKNGNRACLKTFKITMYLEKKQHFKLHLIFISFTFKVMKLFVF